MRSINDYLTEKQTISSDKPNKKEVKCPLITDEIPNGLTVAIDLSQLEDDTVAAIFQDNSVYWNLLDQKQLKSLYNILQPAMDFDEWLQENNHFEN